MTTQSTTPRTAEELQALIAKSDLIEVPSVQSGSDSCGKPILTPSGTILRHRGYHAEVEQYTKTLQKMASMARDLARTRAALEGCVKALRECTDLLGGPLRLICHTTTHEDQRAIDAALKRATLHQ